MKKSQLAKIESAIELLEKTREHININGWVKGRFWRGDAACLYGGLACADSRPRWLAVVFPSKNQMFARVMLGKTIEEIDPDIRGIAQFNDHYAKSYKDVVTVIDQAIAKFQAILDAEKPAPRPIDNPEAFIDRMEEHLRAKSLDAELTQL